MRMHSVTSRIPFVGSKPVFRDYFGQQMVFYSCFSAFCIRYVDELGMFSNSWQPVVLPAAYHFDGFITLIKTVASVEKVTRQTKSGAVIGVFAPWLMEEANDHSADCQQGA